MDVLYGLGWCCKMEKGEWEGSLLSVVFCCHFPHEVIRDYPLHYSLMYFGIMF